MDANIRTSAAWLKGVNNPCPGPGFRAVRRRGPGR